MPLVETLTAQSTLAVNVERVLLLFTAVRAADIFACIRRRSEATLLEYPNRTCRTWHVHVVTSDYFASFCFFSGSHHV